MSKQIYTVVCTDLNDYVNWQVELLEYSWSRINQPGKLVRLVACEDDVELPTHRHAEVYRTPSSNTQPNSDDVYVCYNRLYSLQKWLKDEKINGTILVVDCDVVFTRPINTEVVKGNPIGQHWLDYGVPDSTAKVIQQASSVDLEQLQAVTWPMLIDADDLRSLLPRWIEMTLSIRHATKAQESDMYAFLVAAKELKLSLELGNVAAFMPWPEDKVVNAPLIHYCQVVKDKNDDRIWGKWRYQPWDRIPRAAEARLDYCRDLLKMLDDFACLKNSEVTCQSKTIFIAIASYCDAELVDTIESCLSKARFPHNLRFGICHQFDNDDPLTSDTCLDSFSDDSRFRYVIYDYRESQGGCWARNIVQQLYDNETYTMQIDSHTQMVESWDVILINMLESLPSDKPLITAFPPLYTVDNGHKTYQQIEDLSQVRSAFATGWSPGGWLEHTQKLVPEHTLQPRCTRILSGAFVFTTGEWNDVVRQDPKFLYVGEEFALTLRSFTHGYDLFDPEQIVCWHRLHPTQNRKFRNDNSEDTCLAKHNLAISRLSLLIDGDINGELGQFTLGKQRTLEDFARFSGIDCINKTVSDEARNGVPISPTIVNQQYQTSTWKKGDTSMEPIIDLTIYTKNMEPLVLACYESTPVLVSLFDALKNKSDTPNDLIYLELGNEGQETVYFKKKDLVSINTSPPLSHEFFARLSSLSNSNFPRQTDQQHNQQPSPHNRIDDNWKIWIWRNISRGCSKDSIFKQLIEHGFRWQDVVSELGHQPSAPLEEIIVDAQAIADQGDYKPNPIAKRLDSSKIEIYQIDDFLNQDECQALVQIMRENQTPSTVAGELGDTVSEIRTSTSCVFGANNDEHGLAEIVRSRLCEVIGINPNYAEQLQGQFYEKGGEYKAHYDWFEPGTPSFYEQAAQSKGGQRTWSVVIYLNHVLSGGETRFENADITIYPKQGRLVFWNNLDADGLPSDNALHQACPVIEGHKAILTLWFRTFGDGDMFTRQKHEMIPPYTRLGIGKRKISDHLFSKLTDFYQNASSSDQRDEFVEGGFLVNKPDQVPSRLIDIPEQLRHGIIAELLPICERWSNTELEFSALYGMRIYARGTSLKIHTDTISTHIISVILNVAQQVDQDWPLDIDDHMGRRHSIVMQPGEIVLYEGARLPHGRSTSFNGDAFANIFLHFRPK